MSDIQREFELKFAASRAEMRRLAAGPSLARLGAEAPDTRELRSIYYDTGDFALRSAGFTFRIRRDGDRWEQTIKEETGPYAATADRLESTGFVHADTPEIDIIRPKRLRRQIIEAMGGQELQQIFETVVRRARHCVRTADGGVVELAFDEGEVRCPERSEEISEIEIELKSGRPDAVFALARSLFAEAPLQVSRVSKAERGYRLAARPSHAALLPQSSRAPDITADLTADEACRCILKSCSDQVLHNIPAVLETGDKEGPHQLRIGLRRLRCAFKAHRSAYAKGAFKHLDTEARDLAHAIGDLRNVDVIIDEFIAPHAANAPSEPGFEALLKAMRSRRNDLRKQVRSHLASARVRTFQLDLCALVEGDSAALPRRSGNATARKKPIGAHAPATLDTFWRKASRFGRKIGDLSEAERHEMRKALKNFRYVIEFYAPLYPRKAVKRYLRQLVKLQAMFGFLNDVTMMRTLREDLAAQGAGDAPLHWAVGYLHGSNETRAELAWASARARWKALKETAAFWSQ